MNQKGRHILYFIVFIAISWLTSSCSEEARQGLRPTPLAFGDVNQVAVVTDKNIWESPIGDTLQFYYSAAYPILPQPEPIFDLTPMTPEEMNAQPIRRELRTYLIIGDLSDKESPTSQMIINDIGTERATEARTDPKINSFVGRDKWAKGQVLVYLFSYSREALIEVIKDNFPAVAKKINEADRPKIEATVFVSGENQPIMDAIRKEMGAEMRIPKPYFIALNKESTLWLRRETEFLSSNIILHKVPYTNQSQLTKEGIKSLCDTLGKKYVSSTLPDTYMRINDVDLPMYTSVKTLNNNYSLEARGIWEIVNDYMGGAFVSYLIYNPNKPDLLFIEGFVHAPGKEKRNYMQQLEYLMSSVKY